MELKSKIEIIEISLDGVDFSGEAKLIDNNISVLRLNLARKDGDTVGHIAFDLISEEQVRSIHSELSQLIKFIDNERKVGQDGLQ